MIEHATAGRSGRKTKAALPTPLVPANAATPVDAAALASELAACLDRFAAERRDDPFVNPVLALSLEVSRRLQAGSLGMADVAALLQHLSTEGFLARARRLGRYLGEADPAANAARLEQLVEAAATRDGVPLPFEEFRARVEAELFGVVFTAHPTFNLSAELMAAMTTLATGIEPDGSALSPARREALVSKVAAAEHRPGDLSLSAEHAQSLEAIANIQGALRRLHEIVLTVARRHWPDRWTELTPRLLTVASWVGYDLDGRSDIKWSDTLHKRLVVQQRQLRHYLAEVQAIRRSAPAGEDLGHTLDLLESRLALGINQITDEIAAFGDDGSAADVAHVQRIARRMHEGLPLRLVDAGHATELLDRAIRLAGDEALVRRLAVLRAEFANYGLAMAHTHVRINATQLHNAIRKTVGMETAPDDPRFRQSYLASVTGLLDRVQPVTINFGSIIAERTSAQRLFMVVAQMLKYTDATTPVRFLIAETESAFTVLTALYYARLFGVDDRVDISPLFETEKALETGSRIVEQLLENPHYRDYVRRRGRLCIQTGYSDAGRYLGQTAAAASIERLRLRIARLFPKHGLSGVQLLIFDTHGESIGRGCHPASFRDRLSYVGTPGTLSFMAGEGIAFKQEVSFQGGDGFLYFTTPAGALAVVTRIMEHLWEGPRPTLEDDPFYEEADYIREFFTTVKEFQVGLVEDPNYGALLGAFGTNLLFPSGSRAIKRQHDGAGEEHAETMASHFRAIPHNAILQQLGLPANTVSGVGEAVDKDPQRFVALYRASPRFRQLMGMVEYGMAISSPDALKAYVDVLNPTLWLFRAAKTAEGGSPQDRARAHDMRRLAGILEDIPLHSRQITVFRRLYRDHSLLSEGLAEAGIPPVDGPERPGLLVLHALRLALMQEIFLLATHVPTFSSQHSITHKRLVARLLQLDVPWALDLLARIFPAVGDGAPAGDFGEKATYVSDATQTYAQENERIFRPMGELYELVRRTGTAVTQRIGFFG
ncbi:MAG TPA: phosphoenolpyruvate carboxylase [Azospirillaceae bacterium]|nr:phosphoenolpyruvate carboxylase [Azospirillaceae bacterium]